MPHFLQLQLMYPSLGADCTRQARVHPSHWPGPGELRCCTLGFLLTFLKMKNLSPDHRHRHSLRPTPCGPRPPSGRLRPPASPLPSAPRPPASGPRGVALAERGLRLAGRAASGPRDCGPRPAPPSAPYRRAAGVRGWPCARAEGNGAERERLW